MKRISFTRSSVCTVLTASFVASFAPLANAQVPDQVAKSSACSAQVRASIDRAIASLPRARWSVLVQTQGAPGKRENIYAYEPFTQLVPASNNKVFTTAAALAKLGPNFRFRTPIFGNIASSNLETLRVIGQGDPSLNTNQLSSLTQQLRQRGVRQVKLLIGDDTVFQGDPFNPFWDEEDRGQGYAAPVNSLMLNENNIYTGAVPNPGNYFVGAFRNMLNKSGIKVTQSTLVKRTPAPPGEVELASVLSPALPSLIGETNLESNNVYAEALLKTLGRQQQPTPADTTNSGAVAVKAALTELGVNPNRYSMVDGSGLAERNQASAEAFVQTLQAMALHPNALVFRRSLPVAGISGTLENRFRGTSAQGIVLAKTGTITGVVSLSGYITPTGTSPMVFSMIVNSGYSASRVRSVVDSIVVSLTRVRGC
jgi:serine-type D-Ala-D-Ala carboxypeptidase/endopeptidase (penicillin-binding protein 4)